MNEARTRWPWIVLLLVIAAGAVAAWWIRRIPEPPVAPPPEPTATKKPARKAAAARPGLHRPKPKPCKTLAEGEGELISSEGLDEGQIRAAMDAFLPNALRCVPEGWATGGTIETRIVVGCDGVVDTVEVLDGGAFPTEMVACVKETIGFAPFPAHDQPDGMIFEYPVRLSF